MKRIIALLCGLILISAFSFTGMAQSRSISLTLKDKSTGEPVAYATVSLTKSGEKTPYKYVLTDEKGKAVIDKVAAGSYTVKAELLGYKEYTKELTVKEAVNLGEVEMAPDTKMLDAASVTATGNPIIIKKDTVEYNASSFKTTDNDMLEDLLKKLPGVEVGEDGSVTANGQTINKITIDGKTFFLDDPSLASKNIPAKIVEKVKVVQKKSEQAQFTGIDDGNEETVIDLSVQKGMMNGLFGNVMAGGGHDWLEKSSSELADNGDWRYQGAAFIGRFTEKSQLSIILNANNTNNRGFNDLSGNMMSSMRGGSGGMGRGSGGWGSSNGITSSWMGGINGAWDLCGDKMDLGANYLYNNTQKDVLEKSSKTTYLDDGSQLIYNTDGASTNNSQGHRFGVRLEHKFSDNTSILFQPQFNFGKGNFSEMSTFDTWGQASAEAGPYMKNDGFNFNGGNNDNWTTNGFFLFRQRLGMPGRTLSINVDYNFSNNDLTGYNQSLTNTYEEDGVTVKDNEIINQFFDMNSRSSSIGGRMVYTEPLGAGFYLEANYQYKWSQNKSEKNTYDSGFVADFDENNHVFNKDGMSPNNEYSSSILNQYQTHRAGVNFMFQKDKIRAQLGASVVPTITHNETNGQDYNSTVVNWSPSAMIFYDINDYTNLRGFYFGNSAQPTTSQLMPVPDNSNPLSVSLGNPYLKPYFRHDVRMRFGHSNRAKFFSFSGNLEGGLVQSPIVNASWYNTGGTQFSLPVNGPNSGNVSLRTFLNSPIAKSNFSISNMLSGSWSTSSSYIGKSSFDTDKYYDGTNFDYELFHQDFPDLGESGYFTTNRIRTMSIMERLKATYRNDFVEITASGRTRLNKSWYTMNSVNTDMTRNNQLSATMNWTIPGGVGLVADFDYNWYRGYTTPQDDEYILNVEITKLLFKNKWTLSLKAYDLLNQAKNLSISDSANYHTETWNNTLGRYVILSLTWRFGTMGNSRMGGPMGGPGGRGPGGPMGPPPGR
ncbi:MAG: outer membrane beta-barrel protein [Candidatus Cryptobacteroides sp.]